MAQGTVKWFNSEKGFGFIAPADGATSSFTTLRFRFGFKALEENQPVEFEIGEVEGPPGLVSTVSKSRHIYIGCGRSRLS